MVKATPERRAFFEGLASFGALARLARCADEEGEPLEFGVDVNAARYVDGKRETPNGEVGWGQGGAAGRGGGGSCRGARQPGSGLRAAAL